jgi:BASS family bile acid:Na+ symporter
VSRGGGQRLPAAAEGHDSGARWLTALLGPLHDRLLLYVFVAATAGVVLPDVADRLSRGVPLMLAGQVAGVALTLTFAQFVSAVRSVRVVAMALTAQWTLVPLAGIGLGRLAPDRSLADGIVILGAVPAEITSALVALLAAGSGAVAVACMAGSLAAGTVLTPVWVSVALGSDVSVDRVSLLTELALAVTLPLVAGVALRSAVPAIARQGARALDLSAACVVLVVFVSAGQAHDLVLSRSLPAALALCLALQAVAYTVGAAVSAGLRLPATMRNAVLFPVGMREFGIAAAVAFSVAPRAAGIAGVYGAVLMTLGPALARVLRVQHPHPRAVTSPTHSAG